MTKSTYLFIESIFIKNGVPLNLGWHQKRVINTFTKFFPTVTPINISETINQKDFLLDKLQKCRITYSSDIQKIEYEPLAPRIINSLKIIKSEEFDYSFKYADRTRLESLREKREDCDDIIISINGYLKDSSFANIVLSDGDNYYTPDPPLLYGTKRAQLIEKRIIKPAPIKENELYKFKELHLINALADLGDYVIKINNIFY
jgi:4-amino-4-deoxychorismate lyase